MRLLGPRTLLYKAFGPLSDAKGERPSVQPNTLDHRACKRSKVLSSKVRSTGPNMSP